MLLTPSHQRVWSRIAAGMDRDDLQSILRENVQNQRFDVGCNGILSDLKRVRMSTAISSFQTGFQFLLHILTDHRQVFQDIQEVGLAHAR